MLFLQILLLCERYDHLELFPTEGEKEPYKHSWIDVLTEAEILKCLCFISSPKLWERTKFWISELLIFSWCSNMVKMNVSTWTNLSSNYLLSLSAKFIVFSARCFLFDSCHWEISGLKSPGFLHNVLKTNLERCLPL